MGQVVGNIIVQKRGVVSLGLLKEHNIPLNDGDIFQVQIEDGKVILIPMKLIPADQTWFWTREWQKGEKEAEEDIVAGKVKSFENAEDLLKDLDQ
ncbi:hypothetical protein [Desulfoscipio gibsoniae]|uniref:Uncharacterized protein n=1 Tax=Desulfoscipio gibsoniae DSM 7213 TaxID=767817 RepID=R4KIT9_9FIRM|nr:hypothetical protein [Desulfoscipio gibsoniae]AGL02514.1 hypothetical protein Desgi_3159 [Desulfoscipio gibsoniae DSM 7213]